MPIVTALTMPGSSPHVRAKSKRKKDARQTLADSGGNIQAKDQLAAFIPHAVMPRGRHDHKQVLKFHGKGTSKNPIPDTMMKKPLDKRCFLVNNVKLKLNSTEKLSRCPDCYIGPFSNLSKHYKVYNAGKKLCCLVFSTIFQLLFLKALTKSLKK
jgi:hypothetical protein